MKTFSISELGRQFGLSRSTLLYYDRIGLLSATDRQGNNYRLYTLKDRRKLERISSLRQAGLALGDIRTILDARGKPPLRLLEKRLHSLGEEIAELQGKQRALSSMLRTTISGNYPATVDKKLWVSLLKAAGLDEQGMRRWHIEFERCAPAGHQAFLHSLGLEKTEILQIQQWSKSGQTT